MLASLCCPQVLQAEGFTGENFLGWSEAAQAAFFQNSVLMASTIASRLDAAQADCISTWYFGDTDLRNERDEELLYTVKAYPDFHPSAVVLAVVERECGQYGTGGK